MRVRTKITSLEVVDELNARASAECGHTWGMGAGLIAQYNLKVGDEYECPMCNWPGRERFTMADFEDRAVTLKALDRLCGGEMEMWEAYFQGRFDDEVRRIFEGAVNPQVRTVAVMMRAFLKEVKR